ncbi:RloB family protein [Chryseobacterium sp. B21-037]|uniref:RloB family protein n=1 Tax=Chryseobacterium sp. B21-037 TaxID=2926038 RepID=UPI0023587F69|nr:RloB family protein [Chryseobacterium sp. B21-037]MDC8106708.1 RloB family protein [Chryseobacterium sp. B21-037]
MSQEYRKTLLIVCEGERSEPDYFNNLRNEIVDEGIRDYFIKILPIPSQEKIQNDVENFVERKGGKKRQIRQTIVKVEDFIIEDEYKAQPTCYVRKAQLADIEVDYDELWVVYDKDGHPNHEEAFNLSKAYRKNINIGFCSIAFEMWILLHFEYSTYSFNKSQCRNNLKEVFYCGKNIHAEDCAGENCVVGTIVSKGYLEYNDGKFFEYENYKSNYKIALQNAISLRESITNPAPFYELNPYISLDRLVFKLKYLKILDHIWIDENVCNIANNIQCVLTVENNILNVIVKNDSHVSYILEESSIYLIDVDYNILSSCERRFIVPEDSQNIISENIDNFEYLIVKKAIDEAYILDRSFIKKL